MPIFGTMHDCDTSHENRLPPFFKYKTDDRTRGHSLALAKERCKLKLDIRKYAFSQRTINEWNRLPRECVNATSVNMFKNKIDNYFKIFGYV